MLIIIGVEGLSWTFSNFPTINQVLRGLLTRTLHWFVFWMAGVLLNKGKIYLAPQSLANRILSR